jgi:putative component of toxin-antitoxin plasmid stabilization module
MEYSLAQSLERLALGHAYRPTSRIASVDRISQKLPKSQSRWPDRGEGGDTRATGIRKSRADVGSGVRMYLARKR